MTTPAPEKGPKISIVTVTLNAEDSICRTLRSVANQTYPNLEQIVKDGGSTDQTYARVKLCGHPRLHTVVKPDIGIYDAMNQGAAAAKGQLVLFLNAGDTLLSPTVLEHFVRTAYRDLDRIYLFAVLTKKRGIRLPRTSWPKVHYMLPAYHQGMLYPKSVFADYPFSTRYRIAGDLEHYLTIKNDWPLENTGIHLAQFDDHGISSTNKKLRNMEYQDIYEKHGVNPLFRAVKRIQDMHDWMRFKLIRRSV